jgi:hypothetical protein
METRIIQLLLLEEEMWMDELRQCFIVCDLKTHLCKVEPGFDDAIALLISEDKIRIINRLEAKGNYKKYGEVVTLNSSQSNN